MSEDKTPDNTPSPLPAKPSARSSVNLVRICGVLLLALAVYMYIHDVSANSRRIQAAEAVHNVATAPTAQIAVCTEPQAAHGDQVWEIVQSPVVVSNLLARLAAASPDRPSSLPSFDREYELMLVQTNHARSHLRVRRVAGSDDLWVFLRELRHAPDPKETQPAFVEFEPVIVTGLGTLFDEFDAHRTLIDAQFRDGAQTAYTNLSLRAGAHGFTEEDVADVPAALRKTAGFPLRAATVSTEIVPVPRTPTPPLSKEALEKLPELLAAAGPAELPNPIEGTEFILRLFLEDGHFVNLRIAVPDNAPQDAFVGFLDFVTTQDGHTTPVPSAPALVPGLGALLAPPPATPAAE